MTHIELRNGTNHDVPGRVVVVPGEGNDTTFIWITIEAAKMLPADSHIVSLSDENGDLFLRKKGEDKEESLMYILIPSDADQYIQFDFDDEAFYG